MSQAQQAKQQASAMGLELPLDRGPEYLASGRRRSFLLLRFTLIIATAYLLLAQSNFASPPRSAVLLVLALLSSNVALLWAPAGWFEAPVFTTVALIVDTLCITGTLVLSHNFSAEFFYLYFFLLFIAAIGESLQLIALAAVVVSSVYLVGLSTTAGAAYLLRPATLIRLPFLFAVAIFYGYLVDRVRREKLRASQEKATARQLEEVNQELAKLNQLKSDFVSIVSHELKTPLTSIRNSLSLLASPKTGPLSETQARFVTMAQRNAERLQAIVGDILDLSKIEAGRMVFAFARTDFEAALHGLLGVFEQQAAASSITLRAAMSAPLPVVWIDAGRIEQVLTNLLSNALKFTAAGGSVTLRAQDAGAGVEVGVEDTGMGIAPQDLQRVFEPFYQVQDALTRTVRGTGLGLSIARDLVRAHGGELQVESIPGKGSRFWFTLPKWSERAEEMAALEIAFREYRLFPFFSMLAVSLPEDRMPVGLSATEEGWRSALDRLQTELGRMLPRASDQLVRQPWHRRILVVLLGTPRQGGETVGKRLRGMLAGLHLEVEGVVLPAAQVTGPVCFPEDGSAAWQLLTRLSATTAAPRDAGG